MKSTIIASASFNPKVKNYWTLTITLVCALTLVGVVFTPIVALIVWVVSDRALKAISANLMERKLVVKRGIFFVVEKSIPLEKITDVALSQGPIMRYFGLHQLSFETAGQSATGALVSLVGINDASQFREMILAQKDKLNGEPQDTADVTTDSEMQTLIKSVQNIEKMLGNLLQQSK
jgi:putative membrane protein